MIRTTVLAVALSSALAVSAAPPPAGAAPATKPTSDGAKATPPAPAGEKAVVLDDEPARIAVAYLKSLAGKGDVSARELLLGGLTLTAEEYTIPSWRIVGRDPVKVEEASVKAAVGEMRALDAAGRKTLSGVVNVEEGDLDIQSISQEQAEKIMAPTREAAARFEKKYPVFAYCARVGKDVYWHPSNPWRSAVLPELGDSGNYRLEFHLFHVEERAPGKEPRVWPLRVLRIKTTSYDSGFKILPASSWDPEY